MAKLYFRYGTMGSAKTLNLLAVAHNYRSQKKRVLVLKPRLDVRFGPGIVESRAGLRAEADMLVDPDTALDPARFEGLDCVLVDEAQFLSVAVVEQLRALTRAPGLPVICYGLRTDFRTRLFEGAARLMELADSIEEIKVTCQYCNKKAIFNMRLQGGRPTVDGAQIQLGGDESYVPVCYPCYASKIGEIGDPHPVRNAAESLRS
ncbi:MAG: thymidine kinase [Deltaproteobacteria bacterium]|nr:thymidine kinase [Deltaproteobacteria bacterium]